MPTTRYTTPKPRRRRVALTLAGVLAGLGIGAYGVFAAGGKPDFSVAATPSGQTVSQGQAAVYAVTVKRVNGFARPLKLKVSNLPKGAKASWKLSNGTSSSVLAPRLARARLTIKTAANTPAATSHPLIKATSGSLSRTTTVALVVQPVSQPNFSLTAAPGSRSVLQGDDTSYTVNVVRTAGFSGPVDLSVAGLPSGAAVSWTPSRTISSAASSAVLQIAAAANAPTGSYSLTISGAATVGGRAVTRSSAVTLSIEKTQSFQIAGNLGASLAPGSKAPLDLALTNPYGFNLRITNLAVALASTNRPGCSAAQNFAVRQITAARYPITLPAGQTRTLGQLGVAAVDRPEVEMLNQPWNQDACKNAAISFGYSGSAGK